MRQYLQFMIIICKKIFLVLDFDINKLYIHKVKLQTRIEKCFSSINRYFKTFLF